ncbi:MAG: hypothetical protein E7384_07645 [Ruminococcaceae bacterium]|nr:hypothetical protein [Oscillospiraceae bacterium]
MKITTAKKCKIKIAATAVVLSVVFLAVVIILCESFGWFPGHLCNRIVLSSYMNKNHPDVEYTVLSQNFEKTEKNNYGSESVEKAYNYVLRLDNTANKGETFNMKAYSFKVVSDGYFVGYLRNNDLEKELGSFLYETMSNEYKEEYGSDGSKILSVDCFSVLTYDKFPVSDSYDCEKVIKKLDGKYNITVCITGNNVSYDGYSEIAANVVDVFYKKLGFTPDFSQLIYYRMPADEAELYKADVVYNGFIMQYESRIDSYQLSFDIKNSSGMHYFVELDKSQRTQAKVYNYFQTFYIIFVGVAVIALLTLWSVRKFKKWGGILNTEKKKCETVIEISEVEDLGGIE